MRTFAVVFYVLASTGRSRRARASHEHSSEAVEHLEHSSGQLVPPGPNLNLACARLISMLNPSVAFQAPAWRPQSAARVSASRRVSNARRGDAKSKIENFNSPEEFLGVDLFPRQHPATDIDQEDAIANSLVAGLAVATLLAAASPAAAAGMNVQGLPDMPQPVLDAFDPRQFQPVCTVSDSFYRFAQVVVAQLVGGANYKEFAPLIAGGLLRVRLELCVVESYFNEAVIPFIRENGLTWILPVRETVQTYLAGTIFAVASNFILIGSTKLVTVIFTYGDFFVGFPLRLAGNAGWRTLEEKAGFTEPPTKKKGWFGGIFDKKPELIPPDFEEVVEANVDSPKGVASLATFGALRLLGGSSELIRIGIEQLDVFVGRYLLLLTSAYAIIKFLHFKVFPDFP